MLEVYTQTPNSLVLKERETNEEYRLVKGKNYYKLTDDYKLLGAEEEFFEKVEEAIQGIERDLAIIKKRVECIYEIAQHIDFSMQAINHLSDKRNFELSNINKKRLLKIEFQNQSYTHGDQIHIEYYQRLPKKLIFDKILSYDITTLKEFFFNNFQVI